MPYNLEQAYLVAAEQALGARLPESYRCAMIGVNGGEIEAAGDDWLLHPIADTSEKKRLSRTANHVLKETEAFRNWQGFPQAALAIASNGAGDALVFVRRSGEFEPFVYAWSHETQSLSKVANDFSELTAA